jgi:hypothetical protein
MAPNGGATFVPAVGLSAYLNYSVLQSHSGRHVVVIAISCAWLCWVFVSCSVKNMQYCSVCVCVWERESERERERDTERQRQRDRDGEAETVRDRPMRAQGRAVRGERMPDEPSTKALGWTQLGPPCPFEPSDCPTFGISLAICSRTFKASADCWGRGAGGEERLEKGIGRPRGGRERRLEGSSCQR